MKKTIVMAGAGKSVSARRLAEKAVIELIRLKSRKEVKS